MKFRTNDGDKDKFDESLHYQQAKKFDSSLHYIAPAMTPILPEDREKYNIKKHLECNSIKTYKSTSYLDLTGITSNNQAYTFCMSIKSDDNESSTQYMWDIEIGRLFFGWVISSTNIGLYDGSYKLFGNTPTTNIWHDIIFTLNNITTETKMYLNGYQYGSTLGYTPKMIGGSVIVGARHTKTTTLKANLKKIRLYERIISPAEVLKLHNNQSISESGLILDLPLTSNYSTKNKIYDESGNGNDGTVHECKWNCDWIREKQKVI